MNKDETIIMLEETLRLSREARVEADKLDQQIKDEPDPRKRLVLYTKLLSHHRAMAAFLDQVLEDGEKVFGDDDDD